MKGGDPYSPGKSALEMTVPKGSPRIEDNTRIVGTEWTYLRELPLSPGNSTRPEYAIKSYIT